MANEQESVEVQLFKAKKIKAEQGDDWEQYQLGGLYAKGEGVPQDEVEGYAWLLLAKAEYEEFSEEVSSLEEILTAEQIKEGQARAAELHRLIEQKSTK